MTDKQPIDVVVTYVDDRDEVWRTALSGFDVEYSASRWRSWDILRFWLRGVAQFMPWAGTVYLVVSNAEQVPAYVDRNSVDVVLHEDIIPKRLLPTFNSATIEMFLHRIPRLSERFVYSNDDMLPMQLLD